jgi:predicted porin
LENGFNSGTGALGQGGALFGRQAYVGLTKDGIGSLTLGRQYSFSTDYLGGSYANGGRPSQATTATTSTISTSSRRAVSTTRSSSTARTSTV